MIQIFSMKDNIKGCLTNKSDRPDMKVTCHPRLGGASCMEAGVTGIPVCRIFIEILLLEFYR